MTFPHHLFRAYDIRGVVGDEQATTLTSQLVERVGGVLAEAALARGVGELVIGRDGRTSGAELAGALARGVLGRGCDVVEIGMVPTPVLYFAAAERGTGSGVQVTGSHNPPEYNGLKMMIAGTTLAGDEIQGVKQRVIAGEGGNLAPSGPREGASSTPGTRVQQDMLAPYQQRIVDDIQLARPLKVVIDCGNGVAGVVAPAVFRAIGCEVVELFCEVDGAFPNHHPDPSRPENLQDLSALVQQSGADFGMAFDGDGDRLGVVSSDGSIIWPDRQMLLFAEQILAVQPGAEIIFDVKCSRILPQGIAARGGVASMCKTGHSFVKERLKRSGAAFAGEMSGHLFFNDRWGGFDDGIYAGARLCELLAADHRAPGAVFAALPDTLNTPELRLDMQEGEPQVLVDELLTSLAAQDLSKLFADATFTTIDGIRVDFPDGFGLIRASNTAPAVTMRFEASTQHQLEAIQSRFRQLLHFSRPGLRLPF